MLEFKNFMGITTNSSSEVFVFDNLKSGFLDFVSRYNGNLNFIVLNDYEDLEKAMTSPTAQEKILDYCEVYGKSWRYLDGTEKTNVYKKVLGKTFLFNYRDDPEESKFWYPEDEEMEPLKGYEKERYIG